MHKLTESAVKKLKPRDKDYCACDGAGLNLLVTPNGQKYWILRSWLGGRERRVSLGVWPEVTLAAARGLAVERKARARRKVNSERTFREVADEWFNEKVRNSLSKGYADMTASRFDRLIFPHLGDVAVREVTPRMILDICRGIENAGTVTTAHKVKQLVGQVFRYAIAIGYAESDPTAALVDALRSPTRRHHACVTDPSGVAKLMKNIRSFRGNTTVRVALMFSALTFCRPCEIRNAEWQEINGVEWKIPPEKMKMRRAHIVPLSRQAIDVLRELESSGRYVFPSLRLGPSLPMSENIMRLAIRSMGYCHDEMTPHGFRGMASTILSEHGWPPEVIERQLAHAEKNSTRAAYCHAEYLTERRRMMQWWGDYIETRWRSDS